MTKTDRRTTTFNYDGRYYVDIVSFKMDGTSVHEAYLYDPAYGVKLMMFGAEGKKQEFIDLVEMDIDEYIQAYQKTVELLEGGVV